MLFPAVSKSGLPQVPDDSLATWFVVIKVGNVIIFSLEWLASSILAFTCNLSDALGRIQNYPDFVS